MMATPVPRVIIGTAPLTEQHQLHFLGEPRLILPDAAVDVARASDAAVVLVAGAETHGGSRPCLVANDAQGPNRECALMKVGNNATTSTLQAIASALTDPAPGLGIAAEFSQKQNRSTHKQAAAALRSALGQQAYQD